jgi:Zn-dependent metalloprotease
MNNKTYQFEAEIKKVPDIDGAYIVFPYDIKKEFGKGRVKIQATFDGIPYRGSIVNMGIKNEDNSICYIIGILKEIRKKLNKQAGEKVYITINEFIT